MTVEMPMRAIINATWVALIVVIFVGQAWFTEALAADEVPMISVDQFMKSARADNPHTLQFVAMRCAAVYLTMASVISDADAKLKPLKQGFIETTGRFVTMAQRIQQKTTPDNAELEGGFVMSNVFKMKELYVERAVTARARTGNFSDDPIIRADTGSCRAFAAP